MAERKPLFISDEGFSEEMAQSDSATFGGLTLGGDIAMGGNKVTGAGAATASGELLSFGQVAAELSDLSVTSGGLSVVGGDIALSGGATLTGLPNTPSNGDEATSKTYVDSVAQGLVVKDSVRATTNAPGTLSSDFEAGDAIDNVTLVAGDRILIKDQASGIENGIYIVQASGTPVRAVDFATGYEARSSFIFIEEGNVNADSGWVCTNDAPTDVVDTDALVFAQFSGAASIEAGAGLTKSGNTIDVGGSNSITVNANDVEVKLDQSSSGSTATANALGVYTEGLRIEVDDSTIEGSGQGAAGAEVLRVKDGGITGAKLDPAIDITTTGDIQAANFYIQASGIRDETTLIWREGNDMLFEDITVGSGVTLSQLLEGSGGSSDLSIPEHETLDTLVHNLNEDLYEEIEYTGFKVSAVVTYTDIAKATKIREQLITYNGFKVDTVTTIQYNSSGVEVQRFVEQINYSGFLTTSIVGTRIL